MDEGHDRPSAPDPSAEALLTPVLKRFKHDELATILASDPALASRFLRVSEPFVERQEAEKARLVEEARLEEERKDSEARRDKPEAHVAPLVDELPKRDSSEPILAQEVAEIQKRVENGIRALVAHIVDPAHGLKPESVLSRLLRLDQAMERTTPNAWEHRAVALLTWDYIGLLALAVGAQRDRLEPLERSRVASRFEGSFQVSIDWETIWHGYLHETTYVAHEKSLKEDPLNTPPQILRIPARCKVPTERSSSLLQSLPFEILAQIIKAAASDFIPHQKSEPARAAALVALRSDVLRTLAQVGRAWRPHAQRELVKKPVIRGSHGLVSFLSTINKRKLAHLVQELHLDGGRPVRLVAEIPDERRYQGYDNEHRRDKKLNMLESEADVDYAEALLRKVASEQALWTPLVRLLRLQSLTLQSLDFPTTLIEIPPSIRNLALLNLTLPSHTSLTNLRHLSPSRLDTLIFLDCTTTIPTRHPPGSLREENEVSRGGILETISTLHLDASSAAAHLLYSQHLPAVTTLELFSVESGDFAFTTPCDKLEVKRHFLDDYLEFRTPASADWGTDVLSQTSYLPKLERLVIPDDKDWRKAWSDAEASMDGVASKRAMLELRAKPLEVVWKWAGAGPRS